jgi:hypothetical protein
MFVLGSEPVEEVDDERDRLFFILDVSFACSSSITVVKIAASRSRSAADPTSRSKELVVVTRERDLDSSAPLQALR